MPAPVIYERVPTLLSIVQFDPRRGEEMFLTFTHGRENGPEIKRTGRASPFMEHLYPETPGEVTSHPDGLRLRSWLIQEARRDEDLKTGLAALAKARASKARPAEKRKAVRTLQAYVDENPRLAAHDAEFANVYPQYEIVGQQGCGDLSMNLWHVAFINSPLALDGKTALVFLHGEPLGARAYSCLVKWKPGADPAMTIEDLKFNSHGTTTDDKVWTWRDGKWQCCGNRIEFAVSAKQVIRDGKPARISRRTHQYSDLRHLLQMPNLNPDGPLDGKGKRPRSYFGGETSDDIWIGEAQLIDDINLQRAAMTGPVFVSRLHQGLGASVDQVNGAMRDGGYAEVKESWDDLGPGQYRFVAEDDRLVEVYFRRSCYGWSMVGLDDVGRVLCLACQGNPREGQGHSLAAAARRLRDAGARNALLIDEGFDAFQAVLLGGAYPKMRVAGGGPELDEIVPLRRTRLRATFLFARGRAAEVRP